MKLIIALTAASLLLIRCCDSAYEWRCSSPSNNMAYLPDVPLVPMEIGSVEESVYDLLYIYSYPSSLACRGTAIGVDYCYRLFESTPDFIGSEIIFTVVVLQRTSPGSNTYRIVNSVPVPTPRSDESSCLTDSCCDSYVFIDEQFELPSSDFTYGVLIPGSGYSLFGYDSLRTNYSTNAYTLTDQRQNIDVGSTLTLGSSSVEPLRAMSFRISLDSNQPTSATGTPGTVGSSTTDFNSEAALYKVSMMMSVCIPLVTLLWTL